MAGPPPRLLNIGLDVGTRNSAIATVDSAECLLTASFAGGSGGTTRTFVPSAIEFKDGAIKMLVEAGLAHCTLTECKVCKNMTRILPKYANSTHAQAYSCTVTYNHNHTYTQAKLNEHGTLLGVTTVHEALDLVMANVKFELRDTVTSNVVDGWKFCLGDNPAHWKLYDQTSFSAKWLPDKVLHLCVCVCLFKNKKRNISYILSRLYFHIHHTQDGRSYFELRGSGDRTLFVHASFLHALFTRWMLKKAVGG